MIINLQRFLAGEQPYWTRLEGLLARVEQDTNTPLSLDQVREFHELYERAAAGLAKLRTFSAEPETRRYLEGLVSRAYGEMHETRRRGARFNPFKWFMRDVPRTFRRHIGAFWISLAVMTGGGFFGAFALAMDPDIKPVLMPFEHLLGDPAERVSREESGTDDRLRDGKSAFSTMLMTHNTRVSIYTLALGMTWGVGTIVMLFYNGVLLGAVAFDYVAAGQAKFLCGWLLPHGSIELPAIIIAGQAGLVLARALIGRGTRETLGARLRAIGGDLVTLIGGVAVLLVWAGIVEAFLSQYHEPVLPYSVKIAFGLVELALLIAYLGWSGSKPDATPARIAPPQ